MVGRNTRFWGNTLIVVNTRGHDNYGEISISTVSWSTGNVREDDGNVYGSPLCRARELAM